MLIALTSREARSLAIRIHTAYCIFYDTPGIMRQLDSEATRLALQKMKENDTVLVVAKATHLDEDLADLIPLVKGKSGTIAVTFWDKINDTKANEALERLKNATKLSFLCVDARSLTASERTGFIDAIRERKPFPDGIRERAGWHILPRRTIIENWFVGPLLSILLLFLPAVAAVWTANSFADITTSFLTETLTNVIEFLSILPSPLKDFLVGSYGFVTMFPLLFVWAVPTVFIYALYLGFYKASGLIDCITLAMHPLMRHFGLSGRDLVRVIMGFGCNVPAIINTRAVSHCSRGTCISAIAFGSACSYQFGATLAVFAAANLSYLIIPYLIFLTATTLIYTRIIAPRKARSKLNNLLLEGRTFLQLPHLSAIWREAIGTIREFFYKAIPIFIVITMIASLLDWLGIIPQLGRLLGPIMRIFNLPPEAALVTLLASIRKDGILLFSESGILGSMTPLQVLTGVYIAGGLLPCLVTALTIGRELSWRFVIKLIGRQALLAAVFSLVLAWGGMVLIRLFYRL